MRPSSADGKSGFASTPPEPRLSLPVDAFLPDLITALARHGSCVLTAPPGTGKTTRVPPGLARRPGPKTAEGETARNGILMLEPRRIAARAAARRIAMEEQRPVGKVVGFTVRGEDKTSPETQVTIMTEGIFLRRLQADPELAGIRTVIFDEFHERSAQGDLALTLLMDTRAVLCPEVEVLIMSATLEAERAADLLGEAPIVTCPAVLHPVDLRHRSASSTQSQIGTQKHRGVSAFAQDMARAIRSLMAEEDGSLLAFLPGEAEIRATEQILADTAPDLWELCPLYGALPPAAQDRAIAPAAPGRRKVVLATDIAETSLTIEGVRLVVDGGRRRTPRFDPGSGLTRLETVRISRASADQRAGRAGRQGPGVCLRLWPAPEDRALRAFDPPEISDCDLTPLVLETALWGTTDPSALTWPTPPPAGPWAAARSLLTDLSALDELGRITAHGRRLALLPVHPRLGHMVLAAAEGILEDAAASDAVTTAAALAALLEERDILPRDRGVDVATRLRLLAPAHSPNAKTASGAPKRVLQEAGRIERLTRSSLWAGPETAKGRIQPDLAGALIALAWPDRIACPRGPASDGRWMSAGSGELWLDPLDPLASEPYLAIAALGGTAPGRKLPRIRLAAPLSLAELEALQGAKIIRQPQITWDNDGERLSASEDRRLGALVLSQHPLADPWRSNPDRCRAVVGTVLTRRGAQLLNWSKAATGLRDRVITLQRLLGAPWPDLGADRWLQDPEHLIEAAPKPIRNANDISQIDLVAVLRALVGWELMAEIDSLAPTHVTVPSGASVPLDYSAADGPVLAARVQQLFGLRSTPTIAHGRFPVLIHMLSPAGRPVQVTRDLAGFWASGYGDLRKDLRGRYPKHPWPEDPTSADATNRAKPRKR